MSSMLIYETFHHVVLFRIKNLVIKGQKQIKQLLIPAADT